MPYSRKGRTYQAKRKQHASRRDRFLRNARVERDQQVVEYRLVERTFRERGWA